MWRADRWSKRWDNVARALAAAERLVDDDGAVAICTALDRPPGKSLGRLVGNDDLTDVGAQGPARSCDRQLVGLATGPRLAARTVYLLSRLDDETVEDMGLAPVADVEDLVRLAGRHESCIVLDDSQHRLSPLKRIEERGARIAGPAA